MSMKYILLILMLALVGQCYAQKSTTDKRVIYFYYIKPHMSRVELLSKTLGRISDSLMFNDIELIIETKNKRVDTVQCVYTNNTIIYNKIDTTINKIKNIRMSFNIALKNNKKQLKLTIPYKKIFDNTDENSDVSISVERKSRKLYYVVVSKLDYPFIASSIYVKPN